MRMGGREGKKDDIARTPLLHSFAVTIKRDKIFYTVKRAT